MDNKDKQDRDKLMKVVGKKVKEIESRLSRDEKIPNEETLKAIEDTEKGIGLHEVDSVEELFKELEKD